MGGYFQSEAFLKAMDILKTEFPLAIWETLICYGAFNLFCKLL